MVGGDGVVLRHVLFFLLRLVFASSALHHWFAEGPSDWLGGTGGDALQGIGRLIFILLEERKSSRSLALLAFRSCYQIFNRRAAVFVGGLRAQKAFRLV